jgi:hypothetical protein
MKTIPSGYELINGRILKKCTSEQVRNPKTLRCNKKRKIPSGYEIIDGKIMKKCRADQVRNPKTFRCNKIKKTIKHSSSRVSPKASSKVSPKASPILKPISPRTSYHTILNECNDIKILNENNSCYLDSLLVSLFHKQNPYIYNLLFMSAINYRSHKKLYDKALEIRQELQKIYLIITGIQPPNTYQYCRSLRKMLNEYKVLYNKEFPKNRLDDTNWQRTQAEPLQTLQFFNIMFDFPYTSEIITRRWGTNKKLNKEVYKEVTSKPPVSQSINKSIFIHTIYNEDLYNKKSIRMKDFYPSRLLINDFSEKDLWKPTKDLAYKTKIEKISIQNAPLLFIHVDRLIKDHYSDSEEKLETIVVPEAQIKLKDNTLALQSIIIHLGSAHGGHYICLFKCNVQWYEYDDLSKHISLIGSLDDVYKYNHHFYMKNCTDLIYY